MFTTRAHTPSLKTLVRFNFAECLLLPLAWAGLLNVFNSLKDQGLKSQQIKLLPEETIVQHSEIKILKVPCQ